MTKYNNDDNPYKVSNGYDQINDKVSLVKVDLIKKAKVDHLKNNLLLNKEENNYNQKNLFIEKKNENNEYADSTFNNKTYKPLHLNSINNHYDNDNKGFSVPSNCIENNHNKLTKSINSNQNNLQDFDLTFKNGKNSIVYTCKFWICF